MVKSRITAPVDCSGLVSDAMDKIWSSMPKTGKYQDLKNLQIDEDGNVSCPLCRRENVFLDLTTSVYTSAGLICHLCRTTWRFPPNWIDYRPMQQQAKKMLGAAIEDLQKINKTLQTSLQNLHHVLNK